MQKKNRLISVINSIYRVDRTVLSVLAAVMLLLCILRVYPLFGVRDTAVMEPHQLQTADTGHYYAAELSLRRGIYTIEISYQADPYAVATLSPEKADTIRGTFYTLFPDNDRIVFHSYVDADSVNAMLSVSAAEGGSVTVSHIGVHYRRMTTVIYYLLQTVLPFVFFILVMWLIRRFREKMDAEQQVVAAGLFILAVLVNLPMLQDIYPHGHDTNFHMLRVEYIADGLQSGSIPVRMMEGWFHDYGLPVGVYYPDIFLYLPAFFFMCGVPLWKSYRIYTVIMNLAAIAVSYHAFKGIVRQKTAGFLACAMYTMSMRYIANTYVRNAVGESGAMVFLPLIVLALFSIARDELRQGACYLALGFTGVLQTHVITVRSTLVFCVLACLLCGKTFFKPARLKTIAISALMTFVINAGFIIPFLDYYMTNKIQATGDNAIFAGSGIPLSQLFLEQGEAVNAPGWVLMGVLALTLFLGITKSRTAWNKGVIVLVLISLLTMWMATNVFPYDAIAERIPVADALIGSGMRLKTRYISVSTLTLSTLGAFLFLPVAAHLQQDNRKRLCFTFLILVLSVWQGVAYMNRYVASAEPFSPLDSAQITPYDETLYVFEDADPLLTVHRELVLSDVLLRAEQVERNGLSFCLAVENGAEKESHIDFPLWNYRGYRAMDIQTGEKLTVTDGDNHKVRVIIPTSFSGTVEVRYTEPLYWRMAEILSVLGGLGIAWYIKKVLLNYGRHSRSMR